MKIQEINFEVVKETIYEPTGKSTGKYVDVIFVEGQCVIFGGYKSWITFEKYKVLLGEYNLKKLLDNGKV